MGTADTNNNTRQEETDGVVERTALYDNLPSNPAVFQLNELLALTGKDRSAHATSSGRKMRDRHKEISLTFERNTIRLSEKNTETNTIIDTSISFPEKKIRPTNVQKILTYLLVAAFQQNFATEISFPLSDLVERRMYSSIVSARRGVIEAMEWIESIKVGGTYKYGNQIIRTGKGILFYQYWIRNSVVYVSINDKQVPDFWLRFFAPIPVYVYSLSKNSFALAEYIYLQARVKRSADFEIRYDTIADVLGLPSVKDYLDKNAPKFKPGQYVKKPLAKAITEICNSIRECGHTETRIECNEASDDVHLTKWLRESRLHIHLSGQLADSMKSISTNRVAKIKAAVKKEASNGKSGKGHKKSPDSNHGNAAVEMKSPDTV